MPVLKLMPLTTTKKLGALLLFVPYGPPRPSVMKGALPYATTAVR